MHYLLFYLLCIIGSGLVAWTVNSLLLSALNQKAQRVMQIALFFIALGALRAFAFPLLVSQQQVNHVEAGLLDISAFAALKQRDPQTFDYFLAKITEEIQQNQSQEHLIAAAQEKMQPIFMQYLLAASDENLLAFTRLNQAVFERLHQAGEFKACADYAMVKKQIIGDGYKVLTASELTQRLAMMETVFLDESQMTVPPKSLIAPIVKKSLATVFENTEQDFSALLHDRKNSKDYPLVCQFIIDANREILALPKRQAAAVLRYLYAKVT